jgi:hypothetical protein
MLGDILCPDVWNPECMAASPCEMSRSMRHSSGQLTVSAFMKESNDPRSAYPTTSSES